MKVIKNASRLYERVNNVHHSFMKALKKVHRSFMSLSEICIKIYDGHKKMNLLLYERFNNVHHGFTGASKMYFSYL